MVFRVDSNDGVSRIVISNPEDGTVPPMNVLVVGKVGSGKSLVGETLVNAFHNAGYVVVSLSDVKDSFEFGFAAFEPRAPYHIQGLKKFGCPPFDEKNMSLPPGERWNGAMPCKFYHPFTFRLPKNVKLPPINFYTINIKHLTRIDLGFLAESDENKRSIQIVLQELEKLKRDDGIHHLVFNAENQTESIANLTKGGVRFRSDDQNTFFTRAKQGTEKTSSEMVSYFTPFLTDYALAPESCASNLDIVKVMNDNRHYHIFSTRWITDKKYKSFYILHLLQELLNHETEAKHPICIYLEEIRYLTPDKNDGFYKFLAEEVKNTMTRMRNMGRGFAMVSTTQAYSDVHRSVTDSFNEIVWGRLTHKELEAVAKALKLSKQDNDLFSSLEIGDFILQTKEEYEDEPSMQRVKFFLPPHAHKEGGHGTLKYDWFEWQDHYHHDTLQPMNNLIDSIMAVKERVYEDVEVLKDKENISKRDALKQERDSKLDKEKQRIKLQMTKLQKGSEKKDVVNEKLKELIYNEWQNATGPGKSTRAIARKFNLLMSSGEPNHKAVQRAIAYIEAKKNNTVNETPTTPQTLPSPRMEPTNNEEEEDNPRDDVNETIDEENYYDEDDESNSE